MKGLRGKSLKAIIFDIAEGYVTVNPLFLKPLDNETIKELYQELQKVQAQIRGSEFPHKDVKAIRDRNLKLQRLYSAQMVVKNYMRTRRIPLV